MRPTIFLVLTAVIFYAFTGCSSNPGESKVITLEGIIINPTNKNISVYTLTPFDEMITLASVSIDSAGYFEMIIDTDEPMEAYLLYEKKRQEIFLEPGFELKIRFKANEFETSMNFKGKGSIENTFLHEMQSFNMEQLNKEPVTVPEFLQFVDTYQLLAEDKIISLSSGANNVSDLFVLIQKNKIENAVTRSYSAFVSSSIIASGSDNSDLPDSLLNFWNRLDLKNSNLLYSRDFRKILNTYIADQTERNISRIQSEGDYVKDHARAEKLAIEEFLISGANSEIKEYVLASNISDRLEFTGFKKTKPDFDIFISRYPESRFTALLKDRFAAWLNLDTGNPAPDFYGTTPDGDTIRMSDFRDNVIYLDVWASWCKPCLEEFPNSIKLKRSFSNSEKVVFMYVSIDDDREAWMKRLSMDPDLTGVHLIVDNAWRSEFAEKYVVKDIPRYILIDQSGRIADIEADRPSSGESLESKIRNLL